VVRKHNAVTDSAPATTLQDAQEDLGDLLREVLPPDGSTMGNQTAREALSRVAERQISDEHYEATREKALALGLVVKGRGRGGSIALAEGIEGGGRYEAPAAPSGNGQGRAKKEGPAKDFKTVLWASADKLRAQMDAAEYKHLVLGLIFLKYISDTFVEHQQKVLQMVGDPESDY
jgi:type I restriction enzyme M protein